MSYCLSNVTEYEYGCVISVVEVAFDWELILRERKRKWVNANQQGEFYLSKVLNLLRRNARNS